VVIPIDVAVSIAAIASRCRFGRAPLSAIVDILVGFAPTTGRPDVLPHVRRNLRMRTWRLAALVKACL